MGCEKAGKKVLIIFSYSPEYTWVAEETKGVEEVFKNKDIIVDKFYMDIKRKTDLKWKKKVSEKAMKKIEKFRPDLVIVFDNNASEFVAKQYIGKNLPFVFSGMNGEPEDYGFPRLLSLISQ